MTPYNSKVARATCHRLAILAAIVVPAFIAAPAGAQLNEALQAQRQTDAAAAKSQNDINGVRERTQDAAGRYAQAMADADSLERYNNQLNDQVKSQDRDLRSNANCSTSRRPTGNQPSWSRWSTRRAVREARRAVLPRRAHCASRGSHDGARRRDDSEKYRRILEAYRSS